jgi:hypothetical protein
MAAFQFRLQSGKQVGQKFPDETEMSEYVLKENS